MKKYILVLTIFCNVTVYSQTAAWDAYNHCISGNKKFEAGQYEEAIKEYNIAIELNKQDPGLYDNRASAEYQLGKYEEAIKDCDIAIELTPKKYPHYAIRGNSKFQLGKYEEAIKDFDIAIQLKPKGDLYYSYRGDSKSQLGQYEEAIKDYNIAIQLSPKWAGYYTGRGILKSKMLQTEDAIKDFDKAIEIDSKYALAFYWAGKCYSHLNNMAKAREYFDKVVSLNYIPLYSCYAKIYLGQRESALAEIEKIAQKSQLNTDFYNMACAYAIIGDTNSALKNLDLALSKGYSRFNWLQTDEDLELIHYKPEYIALLKKYNISPISSNVSLCGIITNEVKLAIMRWQEKGEFETTAAYVERMKSNMDEQVNKATQEITSRLKNDCLQKINWNNATLGKYDPDAHSFLLTIEGLKSIVMSVPLADAPVFKQNFQHYKILKKDIVLSNDKWVISQFDVSDSTGTKKYQYDIKNQSDYNPNKIFSLNFAALNINVKQNDDSKLQKQSISQESVTVGLADVDTNIPTNKNKSQHTYALIIGNEDYSSFQPDLSSEVNVAFAVNDATVLKKYCTQTLGVSDENIRFLKNGTSGQMSQAISWINKIIQKEDGEAEVVVYYAGHGLPDEQTHEPYIIPVDVSATNLQSAIKLQTLYNKLTEYPAKKVTVFMDACFSGGSRGLGLLASRGVKIKPKDDMLKGNIVVFTSSSADQSSLPFKDKQHGMFTYYLLKRIQDSKGDISYDDLYKYVKKQVDLNCLKVNNKEQTPSILMPLGLSENWKGWKLK